MNLESVVQKYVDGQALTPGERKILILSLNTEKTNVARFRVSEAEKLLLQKAAAQAGLNLSEYLRGVTVGKVIVPLMNGRQNDERS